MGRRVMRHSLFLKVYLTLLASLVVLALASGMFVHFSDDEDERGWSGRRDAMLAALLPADADPAETRIVVRRLGEAFKADIALFEGDGDTIATVGEPLAFPRDQSWQSHRKGKLRHFVTRLPDGRVLAARVGIQFGPTRTNAIAWLALIAGVTAVAAWPIVRHLTRRLEGLRQGVEAWGQGDLALRVPVKGKDEVAAVSATFNRAAERIENLIAAHRSLLANASHELRSPLARLRMAIDLYEQQPGEARREEIVRNLAELDELVEEILLSSRLDHNQTADLWQSVDLLALTAEEGARHGIAVTGNAVTVNGDPRLLARMVRNLMQNAQRHGAPSFDAQVRRAGETVELSVRDHGDGIPDGESERVFEPFYRPSGRAEAAGGWGLGLALVRQIAERHGATVRHERPADGGTRFIVSFLAERPE